MNKNTKIKNLINAMEKRGIMNPESDIIQANINLDYFHDIIIYCLNHNIDYDRFVKLINMTCNFIDPKHLFEKELLCCKKNDNSYCLILKIFNNKKFKDDFLEVYENIKTFYKFQETKQLFDKNNSFDIKIIN